MNDLEITPCFGSLISKSALERCGSPQDIASLPWLFLIYMGAMLKYLHMPQNNILKWYVAGDLMVWTTRHHVATLEKRLTYMFKHISQWNNQQQSLYENQGKCNEYCSQKIDLILFLNVKDETLLAVKGDKVALSGTQCPNHIQILLK